MSGIMGDAHARVRKLHEKIEEQEAKREEIEEKITGHPYRFFWGCVQICLGIGVLLALLIVPTVLGIRWALGF